MIYLTLACNLLLSASVVAAHLIYSRRRPLFRASSVPNGNSAEKRTLRAEK